MPLFTELPAVTDEQRLELRPEDRKEADRRLEIIAPLIEFKQRTNGHRPPIRIGKGKVARNLNDLAEWLAAQHQVSASSIWRWFIAYDKHGYEALAPKLRSDADKSRTLGSFKKPTVAGLFLQTKYCDEGLNARHSWEVLCREWRSTLGLKCAPPSYATARRFLATLPAGITTLTRQGAEAFTNGCAPFILRNAPPAMKWWISDHREQDVFARNVLFPQLGRNEMYRPWLTAVYDWGSRRMMGLVFSPCPNWATICSALRAPALEYGLPAHFYWDNGKDFRKVKRQLEEIPVPIQAVDVFRFRGTQVHLTLPKHPRSKPVEAYFVRWSLRFDPMWGAAYAGNNPKNCRPECREAQKQHREFLEGKRKSSPLPTDAEFIRAAVQWAEEYNSEARLDCLDAKTPNEVFEEQFPPERRRPMDPLELNNVLSDRIERTILAGGCIEIDKLRYEPDEQSIGALGLEMGKRLTILRDPYNLGIATALDERGKYLGSLRLQARIDQDPANPLTQEHMKAAIRTQRAFTRGFAQYAVWLSTVGAQFGWKTEREALLERALAGTGTDGSAALPSASLRAGTTSGQAAIAAAAPGARPGGLPRAPERKRLAPVFVSDAVAEDLAKDPELFSRFRNVQLED